MSALRPGAFLVPALLLALVFAPLVPAAPVADADGPAEGARLPASLDLAREIHALQRAKLAGAIGEADAAKAAALLATRWEARSIGGDAPLEPAPTVRQPPSALARTLALRVGAPIDDEQDAAIRALDDLPAAQAEALAGVFASFLALQAATWEAYEGFEPPVVPFPLPEDPAAWPVSTGAAALPPLGPALAARNQLLLAAFELERAFPEAPATDLAAACNPLVVPPAFALDTSGCAATYPQRVALSVDVGGNDFYNNSNGGSEWLCVGVNGATARTAGALLDVGGGDDVYSANSCGSVSRSLGANGGGLYGTGFLYDAGGDDQYPRGAAASNGGAWLFGAGFLLDVSGDDQYPGYGHGQNGGATEGLGVLVDGGGNDLYSGTCCGLNGAAQGIARGVLLELGGDDQYLASTGESVNGGTPLFTDDCCALSGNSLLYDAGGLDVFQDGAAGQCSNAVSPTCTQVPKGIGGALVDVPMADDPMADAAADAAGASVDALARNAYDAFPYFDWLTSYAAHDAFLIGQSLTGTGVGVVRTAEDRDGDGHDTLKEIADSSDPENAASKPTTDDDGDGVANKDEQTRGHAAGFLASPRVRATASDHVWVHLGVPGATASVTTPTGATMSVTYVPVSERCPGSLPRPADQIQRDCATPVVVKVNFAGQVVSARRAHSPSIAAPISSFRVACVPAPAAPLAGPCLVGAAVDATWVLKTGQNAAGTPSGMQISAQGKTYVDVADGQGPIDGAGPATDSRSAAMAARLWNWHFQTVPTQTSCNASSPLVCLTADPEEDVTHATVFAAA